MSLSVDQTISKSNRNRMNHEKVETKLIPKNWWLQSWVFKITFKKSKPERFSTHLRYGYNLYTSHAQKEAEIWLQAIYL
jgi:hypothetical protein